MARFFHPVPCPLCGAVGAWHYQGSGDVNLFWCECGYEYWQSQLNYPGEIIPTFSKNIENSFCRQFEKGTDEWPCGKYDHLEISPKLVAQFEARRKEREEREAKDLQSADELMDAAYEEYQKNAAMESQQGGVVKENNSAPAQAD